MLNVRRLCVVVDSLISAARLCDFRMVLTGMWSRGWTTVWSKYSVPAINIVSSAFSLADCTLEKELSTQKNWIYNPRHKSWDTRAIFPSPMLIWVCSHFSAPKYARLNIGEGEGHIWVRTKVWRVNVRNLEKIQDKWLLFQRFVTSIVGLVSAGSNGIEP